MLFACDVIGRSTSLESPPNLPPEGPELMPAKQHESILPAGTAQEFGPKILLPLVTSETAPKAGTPATSRPAKARAVPASTRKVAPPALKLSVKQLAFLRTIGRADSGGYVARGGAEERAIDALMDLRLIKRGAKDKASGRFRYSVSRAGEKHLRSEAPPA